jgi:GntR family transcriptional regulator, transcriptional repressor for pyruvate dehydrogenase complex
LTAQRQPTSPPWYRPLEAGRNFEHVVDQLRRAIETGELKSGDKLPSEPELAGLFGLSRSVVREALKVLELSGYLEVRRGYGGGTFVCAPPAEEFTTVAPPPLPAVSVSARQLIEVRSAVEPYAAGLAAARGSEAGAGLDEAMDAMDAHGDRPAEVLRAVFDFHLEVARICGNPVFTGVLETMRPAFYWAMRDDVLDPDWQQRVASEHRAIAAAIAAADAEAAERLMREHIAVEGARPERSDRSG